MVELGGSPVDGDLGDGFEGEQVFDEDVVAAGADDVEVPGDGVFGGVPIGEGVIGEAVAGGELDLAGEAGAGGGEPDGVLFGVADGDAGRGKRAALDDIGEPGIVAGAQVLDDGGVVGAHFLTLAGIGFEIVEFLAVDERPALGADGAGEGRGLAIAGLMREDGAIGPGGGGFGGLQEGDERASIDGRSGGGIHLTEFEEGGIEIDVGGDAVDGVRLELFGPPNPERGTGAAFVDRRLASAEIEVEAIGLGSVVAEEENDGVVRELGLIEVGEKAADVRV